MEESNIISSPAANASASGSDTGLLSNSLREPQINSPTDSPTHPAQEEGSENKTNSEDPDTMSSSDSDSSSHSSIMEGATGGNIPATVSTVEKLLQQQRNEIMFELRNLQMGERPVTGQGNKEAVEEFFTRQCNSGDQPTEERDRPENVVVEVNALVESRPVSSLLQSQRFRRSLENALRTAMGSVDTRPRSNIAATIAQRRSNGSPSRSSSQSSLASMQTARSHGSTESMRSRPSPSPRVSPLATNNFNGEDRAPSTIPPAPPLPQIEPVIPVEEELTTERRRQQNAQQWLQQHISVPTDPSERPNVSVWAQIEQVQRDEYIGEISELVQREIVTSTLEGDFRNVLERRMMDTLNRTGTNGRQVQQVIQSLPRSNHRRNDFSELGIIGPQQQALSDTLDDVSVISATAAVTVHNQQQQQSSALMSREIFSLKSQITELKNMMKLSFDLQLDMQRSIRQEVAAAMSQTGDAAVAGGATAAPSRGTQPVDDAQCLICLEKTADSVLYQCGHLCVCHMCGIQLKQRGCHCPVCRAPIKDIIRAYKSGQS